MYEIGKSYLLPVNKEPSKLIDIIPCEHGNEANKCKFRESGECQGLLIFDAQSGRWCSLMPTGQEFQEIKVCHDCGVILGARHLPGCDWEECGRCHRQAITCGCMDWIGDYTPVLYGQERRVKTCQQQ